MAVVFSLFYKEINVQIQQCFDLNRMNLVNTDHATVRLHPTIKAKAQANGNLVIAAALLQRQKRPKRRESRSCLSNSLCDSSWEPTLRAMIFRRLCTPKKNAGSWPIPFVVPLQHFYTLCSRYSHKTPFVFFVENVCDPDPTDETYESAVLYLIREQGRLRMERDHWTLGIFPLDTWRQVLRQMGFQVNEGRYDTGEETQTVFACIKTD